MKNFSSKNDLALVFSLIRSFQNDFADQKMLKNKDCSHFNQLLGISRYAGSVSVVICSRSSSHGNQNLPLGNINQQRVRSLWSILSPMITFEMNEIVTTFIKITDQIPLIKACGSSSLDYHINFTDRSASLPSLDSDGITQQKHSKAQQNITKTQEKHSKAQQKHSKTQQNMKNIHPTR